MKASEILEHIIDAWAKKTENLDQRVALQIVRVYTEKAVGLFGDVEIDVRWTPPKAIGDAKPPA